MKQINFSTQTGEFWQSFEQVMIIALGVLMWEGSKPILEGLKLHPKDDLFTLSNAVTLFDFLTMIAIIYRFGFGNILLISTEISHTCPGPGRKGCKHVINLLQIGLTAATMIAVIALAAEKHIKSPVFIYWLFFFAVVVNFLGELALYCIATSRERYRLVSREWYWLVNKGLWIILAIGGYLIFSPSSLMDIEIKGNYHYHYWLLALTSLSNISSFWAARNFFFPFFLYPEQILRDPVRYKLHSTVSGLCNYLLLAVVISFTIPSVDLPRYAVPF